VYLNYDIYKIISVIKIIYCQLNAANCVKLSTVFLNVPRTDTYRELATWIWLSVVPFHRCDVCDVTLSLTPLPYITCRHNNVNPPPPSERDVIYGQPPCENKHTIYFTIKYAALQLILVCKLKNIFIWGGYDVRCTSGLGLDRTIT